MFGPLDYQPEDWEMLCTLSYLKIWKSACHIDVYDLNAIFKLRALMHLKLGQVERKYDEATAPDLDPVCLK